MISLYELERREALEILRKMVLPRHTWRLRKRRSVYSVCIGLKIRQGSKTGGHGLCVKVIVHRKGVFNEKEDIPSWLYVTHPHHGKIMVETDVEDAGRIILDRIRSPKLSAGNLYGSIACALQHSLGEQFLVTARHVLDDVDGGENNGRVFWEKSGLIGEGTYNNVSNWYLDYDPADKREGYVDVGIIDFAKDADEVIYYPGSEIIPDLDSTVDWKLCENHERVRICGHDHDVYGHYAGKLPTGTSIFIDGNGYPYWRMITYCLERDDLTKEGDSGAAVIDETTGTLVGMHLGRRETDGCHFSLVICSGDIISFLKDRLGGEFQFIP